MRFREAVLAEAQDLAEKGVGEFGTVAVPLQALLQLAFEVLQAAALLPCRHRAAQVISFARREAGGDHREPPHRRVEDRHAERASDPLLHRLARVLYRPLAAAA